MIYGCVIRDSKDVVPLYNRKIDADFSDFSVVVKEQHFYVNRGDSDIETDFRFPSKELSIFGLRYKIEEDDWVQMTVKEKQKAEEEYTDAVKQGHQAFLASETKDIYSIKVGRMKKNERLIIEFSYYSDLIINKNKLNFRLPITLVPPYVGTDVEDFKTMVKSLPKFEDSLSYGVQFSANFTKSASFNVSLFEKIKYQFESKDNQVIIPTIELDGSMDVNIQIVQSDIKSTCQLFDKDGDTYVSATFANYDVGEFKKVDHTNSRFVVIVDGSGSMGGDPIKHAQKAVKIALQGLPENSEYCVAMFGSNYKFHPESENKKVHHSVQCDGCNIYPIVGKRFKCDECDDYDLCGSCRSNNLHSQHDFKKITESDDFELVDDDWLTYNETNRNKTQKWLDDNVNADYGGTEMFKVISEGYRRLNNDSNYNNYIIFMTDGAVYGQDGQIIDLITKNKNVNFFSLGIGNGHDENFLNKASRAGSGVAKHNYVNDTIEDDVQNLLKCCLQPNIKNVNVVFENCTVEQTHMKEQPIIFYEEPFVVLGQLSDVKDNACVKFMIGDKKVVQLELNNNKVQDKGIDRCFSTRYIKQLEDNPELFEDNKNGRKDKLVKIAIEYGIVTKFTSAVAIREFSNPDGSKDLKAIDIPICTPKDFMFNKKINHSEFHGGSVHQVACMQLGAPSFGGQRMISKGLSRTSNSFGLESYSNSVSGYCQPNCAKEYEEDMGFSLFDGESQVSKVNNQSMVIENKHLPTDKKEIVDNLILLQNIDGSWEETYSLIQLVGLTQDKITHIDKQFRGTLLILAFFWKNMDLRFRWERAFEKAEKFLSTSGLNVDDKVVELSVVY
jgi:hypothetical protein